MTSSPPANLPVRTGRLAKFFHSVLRGEQPLKSTKQAELFIEALCDQPDPPTCIEKITSSSKGLSAVQSSLRFDASASFHNGPASDLLRYIQDDALQILLGGSYIRQITQQIVEPPIFWNAFLQSFRNGLLTPQAQQCLGWLLYELLRQNSGSSGPYLAVAQDISNQAWLLDSSDFDVRKMGQRIKHFISSLDAPDNEADEQGPGGRHDNDFTDFRDIAIRPTADEIRSAEPPFLRLATTLEDSAHQDKRLAIHLDSQFRLLREDMLAQMRDELLVVCGKKKGPHRGVIVDGLKVLDIDCGEARKRLPWGLRLQCIDDLKRLAKMPKDDPKRKDFFSTERNLFRHQSLACLIVDGEIAAFPTIHRDVDQLSRKPPVITLHFTGKTSTSKSLVKLKTTRNVRLVQIDTAVFAYEPILRGLQNLRNLTLVDELLFWGPESSLTPPPHAPIAFIDRLEGDPSQNIQALLQTEKPIRLDSSQMTSLLMGLKQRVSLIQGPPGTGKSFIGALIAKSIYLFTQKVILVVCFTNHALDQFLEDLLDIGIPSEAMVRLGGKSTSRTKCMALNEQDTSNRHAPSSWKVIDDLKKRTDAQAGHLLRVFDRYMSTNLRFEDLMDYLEFLPDGEGEQFCEAFNVPDADDEFIKMGPAGQPIDASYLFDRWSRGLDAGAFSEEIPRNVSHVWTMAAPARQTLICSWKLAILREDVTSLYNTAEQYNESQGELERMFKKGKAQAIGLKRIIACTTTAAAMYAQELQSASRDIVLVEEAGEILESHILTSIGPQTQQLVLIGDHKQLRPKVNSYDLSVEKGDGFDLNRSLFERLILKDFPHQRLTQQHRMRPEISALVRSLMYPDLTDAPKTHGRPDIRGFQNNLIFVAHNKKEDDAKKPPNSEETNSSSSKQNRFEVDMVLKCIRYLAQQDYRTDDMVVLTPYLGQLQLLKEVLSRENDPILNELDSNDLFHAGFTQTTNASSNQRKIRLATIDNYQGEESDIVVTSLTRSNSKHDVGFMAAPERLNVLLSRARNGLIIIGNPETFLESRKGKAMWTKLWGLLQNGGHVYDGFPVKCERHPETTSILRDANDFDNECPDGGCKEPCGAVLNCGLHSCSRSCHQRLDHSEVPCTYMLNDKCAKGHKRSWKCHNPPRGCSKCDAEARKARAEAQRILIEQEKSAREEQNHLEHMARIDEMIATERQRLKDAQSSRERALAVQQKERDLADARSMTLPPFIPPSDTQDPAGTSLRNEPDPHSPVIPSTSSNDSGMQPPNSANLPLPKWTKQRHSPAKEDWKRQKKIENAQNNAIDSLMNMIGLEEVKLQILQIKAKIEVSIRQNADMSSDRLNVSFLGNPGTGKTTVARLYAKILASLGALPCSTFEETTGASLAHDGVAGAKKILEKVLGTGGGTIFLDEAYQLTEDHNQNAGRQVLDFLLAEMENHVGKIAFIFAGYNKNMEKFFEHNPGLNSRVPNTLRFADYQDDELLWILQQRIEKRYNNKMKIEGGKDGLYMRIVVTRLGRGRGLPDFGNARALETAYANIASRQAIRLTRERKEGRRPDDFYLCKEDLIGPDPSKAILKCPAWDALQKLIGLSTVKESVRALIDGISVNYQRELKEKAPIEVSLNRVFLGSPGTGKTSVAKLYGQILADLGILSNGEVIVKNPSDFMGKFIGHSEAATKAILASAKGKVLIIDEAYMLYTGSASGGNTTDSFKTAIVDTIVAEVQSVPGEDRCVLLLGYEDKMLEMFQNVNPGLSRRFAIENAFRFEDFTDDELLKILNLKLGSQDLEATDKAKAVAVEVLSRGRNRPNFGNGGEVENQLSLAKGRYQQRHSATEPSNRPSDIVFEPQDFDPEYDRAAHASTNLDKLFEDVVGCENIIAKLGGYQQIAQGMKSKGLDPRGMVPTNFLFKGPPGTGKTTTARKVGQVYYDLGFLADVEVIECSASDLIGQYVGQTGPKTRAQLDKALGKVLFIDEAYRLADGQFATEAINELVDQLTKPKYTNKLLVILAGYAQEINKLISINPGLSSRFPEEINFMNMNPMQCLEVLERTLQKQNIQTPALTDPKSQIHSRMVGLIEQLSALPSWGNARDMKTLAKTLAGFVYKINSPSPDGLNISEDDVFHLTKAMLKERRDRCANVPPVLPSGPAAQVADESQNQQAPPPPPAGPSSEADEPTGPSKESPEPPKSPDTDAEDEARTPAPEGPEALRDAGVSDAVWTQLQADKAALESEPDISDDALWDQEDVVSATWETAHEAERAFRRLREQKAADEAEARELRRRQQEARIEQEKARRERERAKEELERLKVLRARQERERVVQERLKNMGVCVQGFQWIKQTEGYRCAGGSHYVGNDSLGV